MKLKIDYVNSEAPAPVAPQADLFGRQGRASESNSSVVTSTSLVVVSSSEIR